MSPSGKDKRAIFVAASLASLAAMPGLALPLLSDDWATLASACADPWGPSPFGYFRPLSAILMAVEFRLFGIDGLGYHLVTVLIIGAATAAVVAAMRRFVADPAVVALAAALFALHPYHVENAAWISARSDVLAAGLGAAAVWSCDRWMERRTRVPWIALGLLELALLAKESAAIVPLFLAVVAARRPRSPRERTASLGGMAGLVAVHLVVVRPAVLGGPGFGALADPGPRWALNALGFVVASWAPAPTEFLESHPWLWGFGAAALAIPPLAWVGFRARARLRSLGAAVLAFGILLLPFVFSFQARYFFLPGAAASVALAMGIRALPPGWRVSLLALIGLGWGAAHVQAWKSWYDGATASRSIVEGLVEASRQAGVREIVVANLPHRVHGVPVAADFGAAAALSGGRRVAVRGASYVDLPRPDADALDGPIERAVDRAPGEVAIRLRIARGVHSRLARPGRPAAGVDVDRDFARVTFTGPNTVVVRVDTGGPIGRSLLVWSRGRLVQLAGPPRIPAGPAADDADPVRRAIIASM